MVGIILLVGFAFSTYKNGEAKSTDEMAARHFSFTADNTPALLLGWNGCEPFKLPISLLPALKLESETDGSNGLQPLKPYSSLVSSLDC